MSLSVSQVLTQQGSVVLGCRPESGSGIGGFANFASIRAIEVGSITTHDQTPGPLP
jgi:hypothetical protein